MPGPIPLRLPRSHPGAWTKGGHRRNAFFGPRGARPGLEGRSGLVADPPYAAEIPLVAALGRLHLYRDQVTVGSLDYEVYLAPVGVPEMMQTEAAARPTPPQACSSRLGGHPG